MSERTRLPADWWPDEESFTKAVERYTHIDVADYTRKFVAEFSKRKVTRGDWLATWRGKVIAKNLEWKDWDSNPDRAEAIRYGFGRPEDRGVFDWEPYPWVMETARGLLPDVDVDAETETFIATCTGKKLADFAAFGKSWPDLWHSWLLGARKLSAAPEPETTETWEGLRLVRGTG
jgi:hypothetical protein